MAGYNNSYFKDKGMLTVKTKRLSVHIALFILPIFLLSLFLQPESVHASDNPNTKVEQKPSSIIINKLEPSKTVTQYLGTSITFSVSASGDNLQYKWTIYKDSKAVYTSNYDKINTIKWTPKEVGTYKAQVAIKNDTQEIVSNYSSDYKIQTKPAPIKINKLNPAKSTTQYLGTSITFSVNASSTSLQYKWTIYKDSKAVYTSSYSKSNTIKWTPKQEGAYKAKVTIKNDVETVTSNFTNQYKIIIDVNTLVKPYIIIGTITKNSPLYSSASYSKRIGTLKKGDKVEIIRDSSQTWYYVRNTKTNAKGWIRKTYLSIPKDTAPSKSYMTKEQIERYVNQKNFSSKTSYFIWVDLYRQQVNVLKGKKNSWKLVKTMLCSSGRNSAPTVRGTFTVKSRGSWLYSGSVKAKYKTNFYGAYYFHSILYNMSGRVVDGRLGQRLSHGCIRLATSNAQWIYTNIKNGTTVYIN